MTRKSPVRRRGGTRLRDSGELDRTSKLVGVRPVDVHERSRGHERGRLRDTDRGRRQPLRTGLCIRRRPGSSRLGPSFARAEHRQVEPFRYVALLPATANAVRRSEWANSEPDASQQRTARPARTPNAVPPKAFESAESGVLDATAALGGGAARTLIEDECGRCGKRLPLVDDIYCVPCAAKVQADRLIAGVRRDLDDAGKDGR